MTLHNIWILPVFTSFYSILAPLICYTVAYIHNRVPPRWPYLSEIATQSPERCIYAMMTNHLTILVPIWLYVKHRTLVSYFVQNKMTEYRLFSTILFALGMVAAVAMQIATNFPCDKVPYVQTIGYLVLILACMFYMWLNTILSLIIQDRFIPRWKLFVVRASLSAAISSLALHMFKALLIDGSFFERNHLHEKGGSWGVAAELEWCVFFCVSFFMLADSWELSAVKVQAPKLIIPGTPLYDPSRMQQHTNEVESDDEVDFAQQLVL